MTLRFDNSACPLCHSTDFRAFYQDRRRRYYRCDRCRLIFVLPEQFLSAEAEKAEYDLHRNSPQDQGYRRFLGRLVNPLIERLRPGDQGLDFGSGPGPALPVMFAEAGYSMAIYDKFYADNPRVFDRQYDFITATEVAEHLHDPQFDLDRLWTCLKPGGWLGLMTKLALGRSEFQRWHYKNDLTHVCFFSRTTLAWLAKKWGAEIIFSEKDVILFKK